MQECIHGMEMADKTAPQKFEEKQSRGKVLAAIFWDHNVVLLLEYSPKDFTATSASYFDTSIHLQKAIKSKRVGLLKRKVVVLHGNATPHSAKLAQSSLNQLKWDVFHHPVYSSDLALLEYHLTFGLKCDVGSRHFATEEDLQSANPNPV